MRILALLIFLTAVCNSLAEDIHGSSTLLKLKESPTTSMLLQSIPEASELTDKALSTFVARKLARNYPFSPTAAEFLESARMQTIQPLKEQKGGDFWFLPLTLIRILVLISAVLMVPGFELRSFRTFLFGLLAAVLITGEAINLSRGLFMTAFIPFEGDHFSFSAPESGSQAVEKLPPGQEIKVSEISGDWIKLELNSGRVGWVLAKDGIIESED